MAIGVSFPGVLSAAQAGAGWAFEVLYTDLAPAVTGYLRLHGAFEADDLASETFIGVFTGLSSFSGDEADFRAWVFTIAHRRLVDDWRRKGRRPAVTEAADDVLHAQSGGDVEEEALASLGASHVQEICGRLPADQRAVLLLRILADLSLEQVAHVLEKTTSAVKALQLRALAGLRSDLSDVSCLGEIGAPLSVVAAMTEMR